MGFLYKQRKWIVLLLLGLSLLGSYFSYDSIGSLGVYLAFEKDITPSKLGFLYSAWGLPTIPVGLIAGIMTDKIGSTITNLIGHTLIIGGTAFVSIGVLFRDRESFYVMAVGRGLAGIGCEGSLIVGRWLLVNWFKYSKSKATAMGILTTLPYFGTTACFLLLPAIAETSSFVVSLWVTTFLTIFCFFLLLIYLYIEKRYPLTEEERDQSVKLEKEVKQVSLREGWKLLGWRLWVLSFCGFCLNGTLWPFVALAPDFYHHKWDYSAERAGQLAAIFAAVPIVAAPIIGVFCDWFKARNFIGVASALLHCGCFVLLASTHLSPVYGTAGLGIVLASMSAVLYTAVPLLVPPSVLGQAFGTMRIFECVGFVLFPFLYGTVADHYGFDMGCYMFALFGAISAVLLTIMWIFKPKFLYGELKQLEDGEEDKGNSTIEDGITAIVKTSIDSEEGVEDENGDVGDCKIDHGKFEAVEGTPLLVN